MDNIILIGFMGCGKSSVGMRLSYHKRMVFLDTDKLIEKAQGREIADIFAEEGEDCFRDMETSLLAEMIGKEHERIISTGGGLPVREKNRPLLKSLGTVVYLKAKPETIYERVKGDTKRPLLRTASPFEKIKALLSEREDAYMEAADAVIEVDGKDFAAIIKEIEEAVG